MKAIILAGGFSKRLWPITLNVSKPLLRLAGKPCITYLIEALDKTEDIDEIIVSTNVRFERDYKRWLNTLDVEIPVKVVIEPTRSEGEKLGAMGGLLYVIESEGIKAPVLAVGGDQVVDLRANDMIKMYKETGKPVIAVVRNSNSDLLRRSANVVLGEGNRIEYFEEKPENPRSDLISICVYLYDANLLNELKEMVGKGITDSPGYLIQHNYEKYDIACCVFDSYFFDIGVRETLKEANKFMKELKSVARPKVDTSAINC